MSDLSVEDVDTLLRKDWFLDMNDLNTMLWDIRDDVFWKVWERRWTYPIRAREILGCSRSDDNPFVMKKIKIRVVYSENEF